MRQIDLAQISKSRALSPCPLANPRSEASAQPSGEAAPPRLRQMSLKPLHRLPACHCILPHITLASSVTLQNATAAMPCASTANSGGVSRV